MAQPRDPAARPQVTQRRVVVRRLNRRQIEALLESPFAGQAGEQATLFLRDPSGNGLEFKAFRDPAALFAR